MAVDRRIRIQDWLVAYDDATQDVTIERTLADIMSAVPGSDKDCMNSRCIRADRNQHAFPHPVRMVSTIKSRVYIVDKVKRLKDGTVVPVHAVRYELGKKESRDIAAHDRDRMAEPGMIRLRVPRDPKGSPRRAASAQNYTFAAAGRLSENRAATRTLRPVTAHSLGARARLVVAVGGLVDA